MTIQHKVATSLPESAGHSDSMSSQSNIKPYIAVVVAMIIWSSAGISTKIALRVFMPLTLMVIRFTIAILLMLVVGLSVNKSSSMRLQRVELKHIPIFLLGGFVEPFIYFVCETYGMKLMNSPTVAEVFLCTGPLLAPLFAFVLIRERVTWQNILGIIISSVGVILMITIGNENFDIGSPWGVVLCFAAVIAAVLYTVMLRKFPTKYNNLSIVFYVQLSGLLYFYPLWFVSDFMPNGFSVVDVASESFALSMSAVVYLAAFSTFLAFVLFCYTVRELGVTRANAFNNIRPVFTAIIMLIFFGEQLPLAKWFAIFLTIIGLFICQYTPKVKDK